MQSGASTLSNSSQSDLFKAGLNAFEAAQADPQETDSEQEDLKAIKSPQQNYRESIDHFTKFIQQDSKFIDTNKLENLLWARYYRALAYLYTFDIIIAHREFNHITSNNAHLDVGGTIASIVVKSEEKAHAISLYLASANKIKRSIAQSLRKLLEDLWKCAQIWHRLVLSQHLGIVFIQQTPILKTLLLNQHADLYIRWIKQGFEEELALEPVLFLLELFFTSHATQKHTNLAFKKVLEICHGAASDQFSIYNFQQCVAIATMVLRYSNILLTFDPNWVFFIQGIRNSAQEMTEFVLDLRNRFRSKPTDDDSNFEAIRALNKFKTSWRNRFFQDITAMNLELLGIFPNFSSASEKHEFYQAWQETILTWQKTITWQETTSNREYQELANKKLADIFNTNIEKKEDKNGRLFTKRAAGPSTETKIAPAPYGHV